MCTGYPSDIVRTLCVIVGNSRQRSYMAGCVLQRKVTHNNGSYSTELTDQPRILSQESITSFITNDAINYNKFSSKYAIENSKRLKTEEI